MTTRRPRYLVFGASGYIGTNLVPKLLAAGQRVRASARHPEVLEGRGWPGAERVDTAFYLVHSMAAGRDFAALDRVAAENFGRAAATAGVRRIVYLGGLIPD